MVSRRRTKTRSFNMQEAAWKYTASRRETSVLMSFYILLSYLLLLCLLSNSRSQRLPVLCACALSLFYLTQALRLVSVRAVPGRSGVQPSAQGQHEVPAAADGGHEVSPAPSAPPPASESPHAASEGHGGGHVRRGRHGRHKG